MTTNDYVTIAKVSNTDINGRCITPIVSTDAKYFIIHYEKQVHIRTNKLEL